MIGHHKEDKHLISNFIYSLIGLALFWFRLINLDWVSGWEDLSNQFLRRFESNLEVAVSRTDLILMTKDEDEDFKAFAHK